MGERAGRLARELDVEKLTGPARALADEAVLITERLERLDATLQGEPDAWLGIVERMPPTVAEVVIDKPLAEVRQQGLALRAVLAELVKLMGVERGSEEAPDRADELAKRRRDRVAGQS